MNDLQASIVVTCSHQCDQMQSAYARQLKKMVFDCEGKCKCIKVDFTRGEEMMAFHLLDLVGSISSCTFPGQVPDRASNVDRFRPHLWFTGWAVDEPDPDPLLPERVHLQRRHLRPYDG